MPPEVRPQGPQGNTEESVVKDGEMIIISRLHSLERSTYNKIGKNVRLLLPSPGCSGISITLAKSFHFFVPLFPFL